MFTLIFEIKFTSNYHIGAGYGKGFGLDSALLREADGTPVIRGSTLAGLLRNGAYRLLGLPPLQKYKRDRVLRQIFGDPAHPRRWHISSARPVERRIPDAQTVHRVRVDPRLRRAEPRKLFSLEEGLAGQTFQFSIHWPTCDKVALDEAAFLVAAARYVRQLGRSRRRGLGECQVHLTEVHGASAEKDAAVSWQDWFLERFQKAWLQGEPAQGDESAGSADLPSVGPAKSSGYGVRVRIILRLDEPVLIAERAPAGNQFETRPFIPGTSILGALANLAAARADLSNPQHYRDFVCLFRRGGVFFSPLYPAHEYRNFLYPTIPAPLGLLTCAVVPFEGSSSGHGVYRAGTHDTCPKCNNRLEPVSGFVVLKEREPYTLRPERSSELHIQIDEQTGRVRSGQLYGYTVLSAGQYFIGELLCADEASWERLQEMTNIAEKSPLTWRIGKARRRGYGQVTAWLERCDASPSPWVLLPLDMRVTDPTREMSLTLLTDTIMADPWGRQATGFEREWLEPALGLGPLEILDAYARTRVVDSFNATLGLPRWRDTALIAGSVVWFRLLAPPDDWLERMRRLETDGIGLRRNEGFGRVAFNHPVYEQRETLRDSAIRLDADMRLTRKPLRDTFVRRWEEKLAGLSGKRDSRFLALARWLYAHRDESPAALKEKLAALAGLEQAFRQPDRVLIEAIGGPSEFGVRSKENFFARDGAPTVKSVCELLESLEGEDRSNWPRGIELLADWLAALADDRKGGAP